MQSSFIDLGLERDGFLYVADVLEAADQLAQLESDEDDEERAGEAGKEAAADPGRAATGRPARRAPGTIAAGTATNPSPRSRIS